MKLTYKYALYHHAYHDHAPSYMHGAMHYSAGTDSHEGFRIIVHDLFEDRGTKKLVIRFVTVPENSAFPTHNHRIRPHYAREGEKRSPGRIRTCLQSTAGMCAKSSTGPTKHAPVENPTCRLSVSGVWPPNALESTYRTIT